MSTTILVVEDETDMRTNIGEFLDFEGYQVLLAENGYQGLHLAKHHSPDLIISDIMMPEMNGYEMLLALQQDKTTATIPILFLSAKADRDSIRKGMGLGADDYISKPFEHEELFQAIQSRLKRQAILAERYQQQLEDLRNSLTRALPHELRTPLNLVNGYTAFLLRDLSQFDHNKIRTILTEVHNAGTRLESLVENYITYSQLELTRLDTKRVAEIRQRYANNPAYPAETIEHIAQSCAWTYEREVDLELDINEVAVPMSETDIGKSAKELIDNAFKFSQTGTSVHVTLKSEDKTSSLTILDHGCGMKHEDIQQIAAYKQFERDKYEQQGLGLGLAIVKNLIELYGGKITIQSSHNKGTCVTATFEQNH